MRKTVRVILLPKNLANTEFPKLVIIKFNGTHTDWRRVWSQFEADVEATEIAKVTKFSYFKELLDKTVRANIDGLPFTS